MPFVKELDGSGIIPAGTVRHEMAYSPATGWVGTTAPTAVPSWLVNSATTTAFADPGASQGQLALSTSTTSGNSFELVSAFSLDLIAMKELRVELWGLRFDRSDCTFAMGFMDVNTRRGARLIDLGDGTPAKIQRKNAALVQTLTDTQHRILSQGTSAKWQNVGFVLRPGTKEMATYEPGIKVAPEFTVDPITDTTMLLSEGGVNSVQMRILVKTNTAAAVKMSFQKLVISWDT